MTYAEEKLMAVETGATLKPENIHRSTIKVSDITICSYVLNLQLVDTTAVKLHSQGKR